VSTTLHSRVRVAFLDEWCLDLRCSHRRQAERLELVHPLPRSVPATNDLLGTVHGRDVDHALFGCPQDVEGVVASADHATDEWRLEFHHRVPRQRHDVRPRAVGCAQQDDWAGFEQAVDMGQRKDFLDIGLLVQTAIV